ncbi:MAG TPA: c-type cytochrome domain-containing protein [Saprospiraceae bacterium]|nr:c-type cytochrome domain-containing protein [Saprospiraceae bacterium]
MNRKHQSKGGWMIVLILLMLLSAFIPSCTHDPFTPVVTGPIDTTGNPIDTTGLDTTSYIPCDTNVVYFKDQVLPILVSNCAKSGCHNAASHEEGLVLDTYDNVMKKGIVKAGNPTSSKLVKVIKQSNDDAMPPYPNQRLTASQIALISKWIQQGAKDLTCDVNGGSCDTTSVTYSKFMVPLMSTYCVGCHSGGNPSGGIALNSFANVQALALNGRLVGAVTWAPGFQQMPQSAAKLPSCYINKLKAWVNNGAPNN